MCICRREVEKTPHPQENKDKRKKRSINLSVTTRRQRGSRAVFGTRNGRRSSSSNSGNEELAYYRRV
jgi:hypothetical protein